MITARLARDPAHGTAVLVRLVAMFAAVASLIVVPTTLATAVAGHTRVSTALVTAGVAIAVTLVTGLAARSLDPLRR